MLPRAVVPLVSLVPLPERCPLARTAFLLALKGSATAFPGASPGATPPTVALLMGGTAPHLPHAEAAVAPLHGCQER